MRLSSGAALLAFAPAVLGWRMTLYSQEDCNDHDGDFSYVCNPSGLGESIQAVLTPFFSISSKGLVQ